MKNDLIIRAAKGEHVDRVPVWIMRQAGRYLKEFRDMRVEQTFFALCQNPQLACEVTLMVEHRYLMIIKTISCYNYYFIYLISQLNDSILTRPLFLAIFWWFLKR